MQIKFNNILVTGVAGFIGFHLCSRLLQEGYCVFGVDNVNDYYDITLKEARLNQLMADEKFTFYKIDLEVFTSAELARLGKHARVGIHADHAQTASRKAPRQGSGARAYVDELLLWEPYAVHLQARIDRIRETRAMGSIIPSRVAELVTADGHTVR